jgi:hypothetical protein
MYSLMPFLRRLSALVATVGAFLGCGQSQLLGDRLGQAEIAALGPEDPMVPAGPRHRPGQPCAVCHNADGTATAYVAAGTIYRDPAAVIAVADVQVSLIDTKGNTFATTTNCVGNFYVKASEFRPVPPFWTSVQLGEFPFRMASPIHREASCVNCHFDPAGGASAGHIFVADDEATYATLPARACAPADGEAR